MLKKIRKKSYKFSNLARQNSAYQLLAIFFLTLFCVFALPNLQTQYSLRQFLPQDNSLLARDAKVREKFQLIETQPFILTAKINQMTGTWFENDKIQALKSLTAVFANFPGVRSTLSLATVQGALYTDQGVAVGPLLEGIPKSKWASQVIHDPLLTPNLISTDAKTASLFINLKRLNSSELSALKQTLAITAEASLPFAHVDIGGTPAVQSDVGILLQSEVRNFVILGFLTCFLVLGLIFSNWSPLIISFLIILVANIWVVATMASVGFPFTILSSTIPILTTVDVVSLVIHTLLRFIEERKDQPDLNHHELVKYTFKVMMWPNFIASTTTMIGFLALLSVQVPLIRDYGITAAGAIVIGWLATTLMIYPLLHFLPAPKSRKWAWKKARWSLHLLKHPSAWAFLIIFVSLALVLRGQSLSWSARLFDDLPANHQVRLSTERIDKELGGMIPIDIEIKGSPDTWNNPNLLDKLSDTQSELRTWVGVGSTVGLPELITAAQAPDHKKISSRSQVAETYFLYSLSNENPLKNFLTSDGSAARISLRAHDLPSDQLQELVSKIENYVKSQFPELQVQVAGMGATIHQLNNQLSQQLIFGFWHSLIAIGIILIFVFKSLRWALVSCIPNLVPPAALLGFLAISQTPIKPSVAIIFSIALGLAFNNTVYLLERLRIISKSSLKGHLNIEKTMWCEANPCLISSLTLIAGFSVFMASYFPMNRIFGFYMVLSVFAGLIGDLILLPTLLKSCPWLLKSKRFLQEEKTMAPILLVLLSCALMLIPRHSFSALPLANKISEEMVQKLKSQDEEFLVNMKIIEADGVTKERQMHVIRMSPSKDDHSLLVRMQKPPDLKGTALLAKLKKEDEEKWIYLPSSKQTRRLTGDNAKGGILGSELSVEDFDFGQNQHVDSEVKAEVEIDGKKHFQVESQVNESSANYSRVVSYVSSDTYLPRKMDCYDKNGKLLKVIDFKDYLKVTDKKFRPRLIYITNTQNKRATELKLSQIKLNQNIKASRFTPNALSR